MLRIIILGLFIRCSVFFYSNNLNFVPENLKKKLFGKKVIVDSVYGIKTRIFYSPFFHDFYRIIIQ